MNKYLLISVLCLFSMSVFASCPIDNLDACIADFQSLPLPLQRESVVPMNSSSKNFSPIQNHTDIEKETKTTESLRKFGPQSQNFGYNSSCQFGTCQTTGTPQNFTPKND